MPIIGAFMVPHPPLAVYEVGRERTVDIKTTIDNYNEVAKEVARLKPDTIVISSPHAPLYKDAFYIHMLKEILIDLVLKKYHLMKKLM